MLKSEKPSSTKGMSGVGLIDVMIVMTVIAVLSAISIPQFMQTMYNAQLRSAAAEVADLFQQARMGAARVNTTYPVRFQINGGLQQAYIDYNNNSTQDTGEPLIDLPNKITGASGAPNGSGGQPSAYVLVGDTSSGTPFDNSNVIAFSPRGLPCDFTAGTACSTPASSYFVFYFTDSRSGMWSAVCVTKSGRTKVLMWNGGAWK